MHEVRHASAAPVRRLLRLLLVRLGQVPAGAAAALHVKPPVEQLGSVGAVIAAAACPVCFPKLALVGALLGLGGLGAYEAQLFIAAQALVILAVAGHVLSFRQHRKHWLLAIAILGGAAVFFGLYLFPSEWLAYLGLAALVVASAADLRVRLAKTRIRLNGACAPQSHDNGR